MISVVGTHKLQNIKFKKNVLFTLLFTLLFALLFALLFKILLYFLLCEEGTPYYVGCFDEQMCTHAKILFQHMSIWSAHFWVSLKNGWYADMLKVFQKIECGRPMWETGGGAKFTARSPPYIRYYMIRTIATHNIRYVSSCCKTRMTKISPPSLMTPTAAVHRRTLNTAFAVPGEQRPASGAAKSGSDLTSSLPS